MFNSLRYQKSILSCSNIMEATHKRMHQLMIELCKHHGCNVNPVNSPLNRDIKMVSIIKWGVYIHSFSQSLANQASPSAIWRLKFAKECIAWAPLDTYLEQSSGSNHVQSLSWDRGDQSLSICLFLLNHLDLRMGACYKQNGPTMVSSLDLIIVPSNTLSMSSWLGWKQPYSVS